MSAPGWDGILEDGERILWQGRPDHGFHVKLGDLGTAGFGVFFAGFAVLWMALASQGPGGFWMFGLIHFSVGLWLAGRAIYGNTLRRRHTWYTLTNRRAFIATDLPLQGKRLNSYPITADMTPEYLPGQGLETIYFATEERRGSKGRRYHVKVGFERVEDGEVAWRILREVQQGQHA